MDMNEGENSGIPQSPNFSSPNISSGDDLTQQNQDTEPTPQAITSSDVAAMSGTDAGAVAAAAASMTEDDERTDAIVSSGSFSRPTFTNRRYSNAQETTQKPFSFAVENQQGGGSIVINNSDYDVKPRSRKKLIVGALALVILVAAAVILIPSLLNDQKEVVSEEVKAWRRVANYMIYGEEKEDKIELEPASAAARAMKKGVFSDSENAATRFEKLTELHDVAKEITSQDHMDISEYATEIIQLLRVKNLQPIEKMVAMIRDSGSYEITRGNISEMYNTAYRTSGTDAAYVIGRLELASIARLDLASQYINNGCAMSSGALDTECRMRVDKFYADSVNAIRADNNKISVHVNGIYEDFFRAMKELEE